jgi:hypothetical protein
MNKRFAVALLGASAILAAGSALAADPIIGSWKLNQDKSKFDPGPAPKSATRVYTETGEVYTLESNITAADGKNAVTRVQYRQGEMKITDEAGVDTIAAKKINANTWDFELKSGGKVVGKVHRVVSTDGKSLSVHNTGTLPGGGMGDDRLVYDKQ